MCSSDLSVAFFRQVYGGLPSLALAKGGGKSGLRRVGRPGVVLGDFVFKHEGRKVPQKTDRPGDAKVVRACPV